MLNLVQDGEELNRVYGEDYYWYLRSDSFRQTFLASLGGIINEIGLPCLDVGCGEGQLGEYVTVPYVGFDGSVVAIERARRMYPAHTFHVGRIEAPAVEGQFGTVVFGGLLRVSVKQEQQVEFAEMYRKRYGAEYLVVYDLVILDTSRLDATYQLHASYEGKAELENVPEVKLHRKIRAYRCG